jgi:hypothetical protein
VSSRFNFFDTVILRYDFSWFPSLSIGFGAFNSSASSTSHARVSSSPDSCVGQLTPNIYLKGTKIHVINGKHEGLSAEIVSYSAVGWYTASFKGSKETWKIRSCDFRVIQNK